MSDNTIEKYDRPQPMQEVEVDPNGDHRFRPNALVRYLLDAGGIDMNQLAALPNVSGADHEQFAQLIGYSVSGFGELSYTSDATYAKAAEASDALSKKGG